MTSNPTSEGLVERLRNWPNGSMRDDYSVDSIRGLLSEAADRIEALEGERSRIWRAVQQFAHDTGATAGTDVYEWFATHTDTLRLRWKVQDDLFDRLTTSEALVTSLRNQLEEANHELQCCDDISLDKGLAVGISELQTDRELLRNQLEGAKEALRGIAHGPTQPARALAASTLYGLENINVSSVAGAEVAASTGVKSDSSEGH